MRKNKTRTIWCYLDGKKHCDVVQWALAANVMVTEAKRLLMAQYPGMDEPLRRSKDFYKKGGNLRCAI